MQFVRHTMYGQNHAAHGLDKTLHATAHNADFIIALPVVADTRDDGKQVDLKMKATVEVSRQGKTGIQNVGVAMQTNWSAPAFRSVLQLPQNPFLQLLPGPPQSKHLTTAGLSHPQYR